MTTTGRPEDLCGESEDLPGLPPHPTSWLPTGYRDENARLLVTAMYRHRHSLLRDCADVPLQGYDVLPAEVGQSGGLTCGILISLWHGSPLCRGVCPVCGDVALAFAIGGTDDDWLVVGVCRLCAYLAHRPGKRDDLLAELDGALEGTHYTLPTPVQLLSTNGHAHTALLGALAARGVVLLPAPHYGFMAASPEVMIRWHNPVWARVGRWAWRVTVRHAPSGAQVERTDRVMGEVWNFVERHLQRTGRLPELEHEMAAELRYCFPMISQELVVTPPRPPAEEDEEEEDLTDMEKEAREHQPDIDALIASARAGKVDDEARQRVIAWLDGSDAAQGQLSNGESIGQFLGPDKIARAYKAIDDDEVREALELNPRRKVTHAQRIEFLELYRLPGLFDDADETYLMVDVLLQSSSGDTMVMVAGVQGYSFTMLRNTWWGPVKSAAAFMVQLDRRRWVESVEEFGKLSMRRKVEIVTGRVSGSCVDSVTDSPG